jgi:mycofactocin glycosyltransferase
MISVSIVVMTRDRPEPLRRCLESLSRLRYPRDLMDVIVVDSGPTQEVSALVRSFEPALRIRYARLERAGVAAARNAGLALATAPHVAFLPDDNRIPPDYLEVADKLLGLYPEARLMTFNVAAHGDSLACLVERIYHELVLLQNSKGVPDENGVIKTFTLPASRGAVWRREVFSEVGVFDESLLVGEDGDMGLRLARLGHPVYFKSDFYLEHWEGRGWREYLALRRKYAGSLFEVLRKQSGGRMKFRRWSPWRCAAMTAKRLNQLGRTARLHGKLARFLFWLPGLALFHWTFFSALLSREEAELAASRPDGVPAESAG